MFQFCRLFYVLLRHRNYRHHRHKKNFSITALSLSFSTDKKSLLTTWTDKWLFSTGAIRCLVERPVMLSVKLRLSQFKVFSNSFRKSRPRISSLASVIKNVKGDVRRKEKIKIDMDILAKILIGSPLTVPSFLTVSVTKFVLTKLNTTIDVIEYVPSMKSIELSPNLAAVRMQRSTRRLTRTI